MDTHDSSDKQNILSGSEDAEDTQSQRKCYQKPLCLQVCRVPPCIKRSESLSSPKSMEYLRKVNDQLHQFCYIGQEAEQDHFLMILHEELKKNRKWDMAFAILCQRNIHFVDKSAYKHLLKRFKLQLRNLEASGNVRNRAFIQAGFCQRIARIYLRKEKPGKSHWWLKKAQKDLQNSECCDWTGDLLHSLGATTTFVSFQKMESKTRKAAYHYYNESYRHYKTEQNPDTDLRLIQISLCKFNNLVNVYLFKPNLYHMFFKEKVCDKDLQKAAEILEEIRCRYNVLDHRERWPEILMDITINQALLMIRRTDTIPVLGDKLCTVSSIMLEAQTDFNAFNKMQNNCNTCIFDNNGYPSDISRSGSDTIAGGFTSTSTDNNETGLNDSAILRTHNVSTAPQITSNGANPQMIERCHQVYILLQQCLFSYVQYLTQSSTTQDLKEAYQTLPLSPVLQIQLHEIIQSKSNMKPDDTHQQTCSSDSRETEQLSDSNLSSITHLSSESYLSPSSDLDN